MAAGLCQTQARSQELPLGLLCGWQGPKHSGHLSQVHQEGAGSEMELLGLAHMGCWIAGGGFYHLHHHSGVTYA